MHKKCYSCQKNITHVKVTHDKINKLKLRMPKNVTHKNATNMYKKLKKEEKKCYYAKNKR